MTALQSGLVVIVGYLVGSIPWGLIVGHLVAGIDIRKHGSGALGATNALRTLGWKPSVAVFILDVGKGMSVILGARALGAPAEVQALAGIATVIGHCWPLYIGFRGGKGVATSLGIIFAVYPEAGVVALVTFAAVVGATRYVSLGSLTATLVGIVSVAMSVVGGTLALGFLPTILAAAIIFLRHRDNIRRLRAGTEHKLGEKAKPIRAHVAARARRLVDAAKRRAPKPRVNSVRSKRRRGLQRGDAWS